MLFYFELVLAAVFVAWIVFWNIQGYRLSHISGYFAPRLTCAPLWVRWIVSTIASKWFVGPVNIEGWENTNQLKGKARFVVAPNHQFMDDATLLGYGMQFRHMRFLIAINQTQHWAKAPFLAWMGAISVGYDKTNRAAAAVPAAVNCLAKEPDCILAMFPQGKLELKDEWDRTKFFDGIVKIAKAAEEKTGQPFYIVPVVAQYDFDPAHATNLHRLIESIGLKKMRLFHKRKPIYAATIYIGRPLRVAELPEDNTLAMDMYFQRMIETRDECRKLCGYACESDAA